MIRLEHDGWPRVPSALELRPDEVHVFARALDAPDRELDDLRSLLSAEEGARADRFVFERHRREFTIARGVLRLLLARFGALRARELEFAYGPNGKPALAPAVQGMQSVRFNLSHSGGMAVYAVALGREVGVDIEQARADIDCAGLAQRFFSHTESTELLALPNEERLAAFYRCWTRKEAVIKAMGAGLSLSLDAFDVSLRRGEAPRLLAMRPDSTGALRWDLSDLPVGAAYAGALAVEGRDARVNCWELGNASELSRLAL